MNFLSQKALDTLVEWRLSGVLRVVYVLAVEALAIGYLYFIGLFTLETLLPTFITARFSLTLFFFVLLLCTFLVALLGQFLELSFPFKITRKSPLFILGLLWGTGILVISLVKFPLWAIAILVTLFLFSSYLFWHIFAEEKSA